MAAASSHVSVTECHHSHSFTCSTLSNYLVYLASLNIAHLHFIIRPSNVFLIHWEVAREREDSVNINRRRKKTVCRHCDYFSAAAPEMISTSSLVMTACRWRLYMIVILSIISPAIISTHSLAHLVNHLTCNHQHTLTSTPCQSSHLQSPAHTH